MIIGISGYARSGKDTVASILEGEGFTRIAFADMMRDALLALNPYAGTYRLKEYVTVNGWEVAKTAIPEVRNLLQKFGTDVGRDIFGESFWIDQLVKKYDLSSGDWVISDVRFLNEAQFIKDSGGKLCLVVRDGITPVNGHKSDQGIDNFTFDVVFKNDTLSDLKLNVLKWLK